MDKQEREADVALWMEKIDVFGVVLWRIWVRPMCIFTVVLVLVIVLCNYMGWHL